MGGAGEELAALPLCTAQNMLQWGVTEHMRLRELEFLWPNRTSGELCGLSVELPELPSAPALLLLWSACGGF